MVYMYTNTHTHINCLLLLLLVCVRCTFLFLEFFMTLLFFSRNKVKYLRNDLRNSASVMLLHRTQHVFFSICFSTMCDEHGVPLCVYVYAYATAMMTFIIVHSLTLSFIASNSILFTSLLFNESIHD